MNHTILCDIATGQATPLYPVRETVQNPCTLGIRFRRGTVPTLLSAVQISGITLANPAVITTATAHGLSSGQAFIQGVSLDVQGVNGFQTITVIDSTHFSIPTSIPRFPRSLANAQVGPLTPTLLECTLVQALGGAVLSQAVSFTLGPNLTYLGTLSLSTTGLLALFGSSPAPQALLGLIYWQQAGDSGPQRGPSFPFTVSGLSDGGGTPTPAGTVLLLNSTNFQFQLNAYTGGAANCLDSIVTVGVTVGVTISFNDATDGYRVFQLTSGSSATSAPSLIRPADFNSSTNAKVWAVRL